MSDKIVTMTVGGLSLLFLIFSVLHTVSADLSEEAIYYTFAGKICDGPCYQNTCRTIDGFRGKCSNYEAKVIHTGHSTSNIYFPCIRPCDTFTKKCSIFYGTEDCHPNDVIYFTKDYTVEVTYCETPCLKYGASGYRCYDSSRDWVECGPFPNKQKKLMEIFRRINVYGAYTEQGYRRCGQCECSPGVHVKNADYQKLTKDFTFNEINITAVMKYYKNEFPIHVVRQVNPIHIVSSSETNPILSYNMMPVVGEWTNEGVDQLFLPLMVTSLITNYTKPSHHAWSKLPTRVEKNYRKMNPAPGDEHTYIIDRRFNGPHDLYNIFPGTRFLNRGQRSPWTHLNNAIAKFVHENVDAYVYLSVILSYDFEELFQSANFKGEPPKINMRPNAIGVNVRFFNHKHELTDDHGVPLGDKPNPYENMFFSNNADHCCALDFTDHWN